MTDVCLHERMTDEHMHCPDCGCSDLFADINPEQFGAVRAWAGLWMWCEQPMVGS